MAQLVELTDNSRGLKLYVNPLNVTHVSDSSGQYRLIHFIGKDHFAVSETIAEIRDLINQALE